MLDLQEIENTIHALENASTTFDTCSKLASLYIVRDNLSKPVQTVVDVSNDAAVERELTDILPTYGKYVDTKRKFQLNQVPEEMLITATKSLCIEIQEFLTIFYSTTELPQSRIIIVETLTKLLEKLSK